MGDLTASPLLLPILVAFCVFVGVPFVNSESDGCTDMDTNKEYNVGEKWNVEGTCAQYACANLPVPSMPDIILPSITKTVCSEPKPLDNDLRNCHKRVPYPSDPFPKCCPHLFCNRPGLQQIIKPDYETPS